jgi:hypothetical protein
MKELLLQSGILKSSVHDLIPVALFFIFLLSTAQVYSMQEKKDFLLAVVYVIGLYLLALIALGIVTGVLF